MNISRLTNGKKTIAVVCNQWGDAGKGKVVDLLADEWADMIIRGGGGGNAGHTIWTDGKKYVFHSVPSGILHDSSGKINIIGSGVAFDPKSFLEELDVLKNEGFSYNNLMIAYNAHLLMPQHILLDNINNKVGTTGRGIGPLYTDIPARVGLTVNDMLNKDILRKKLVDNLEQKIRLIKTYDPNRVKEILASARCGSGVFYSEKDIFDIDMMVEKYHGYGLNLKDLIRDTDASAKESIGKKNILLEGAQGLMLDVKYGTYPFVTSSKPSVEGLAEGAGLHKGQVDLTLGIAKFYITRVGDGPFPTELGGNYSADWCKHNTKEEEKENYPNASMNCNADFERGIAIRFAGDEYGATTKRPRRTGWFDLPLLRYAAGINGTDIVITKPDALTGMDVIKVCEYYAYMGKDCYTQGKLLKECDELHIANPDKNVMDYCVPVYEIFDGWKEDISEVRKYEDLPANLRKIIDYISKEAGVNVRAVSVGPDREQIIIR